MEVALLIYSLRTSYHRLTIFQFGLKQDSSTHLPELR